MSNLFIGPGRWVLALFALWCLLGQHVFIHHLGGVGLDLPFNAITWLFVGAIFIAGAGVLQPKLITSPLGWCLLLATVVLWLPWWVALAVDMWRGAAIAESAYWQVLPRLLGLAAGVVLFWILQQCRFSRRQRHFVLVCLLTLASVQIGFGLVQFFVLPADNWFMYNTKIRFPYGIFMQRNVMSSFVGSGVLLALYLLVRRTSGKTGREQWQWWLWCSLVAIAGLVLVVLLQSRAGLYSLIAGLCLLLPVCWLRLNSRLQRGVLLALVVCGAGAGLALLLHFDLHRRALAVYGELGVRYEIWQTTLGLIAQHFWEGVGYGRFEPAYYAEAGRLLAAGAEVPAMPGNLHHPHNEILLWWVEGGVITLLAWLLVAWGLLRLLGRLSMGERLALIALCLPLFAHLMSEYPFEHARLHWIWLVVILWYFDGSVGEELSVKSGKEASSAQRPAPSETVTGQNIAPSAEHRVASVQLGDEISIGSKNNVFRVGLMLLGCVTVLYMATGLQTAYQLTQYQRGKFNEPERVAAVWNPYFWADRQALYQRSKQLTNALAKQDAEEVKDYLAWSSPVIARLPRTSLLHNHLVALLFIEQQTTGAISQADALVAQLQLEYPHQGLFKTSAIEKLKEQLTNQAPVRVFQNLTEPVGSATYY